MQTEEPANKRGDESTRSYHKALLISRGSRIPGVPGGCDRVCRIPGRFQAGSSGTRSAFEGRRLEFVGPRIIFLRRVRYRKPAEVQGAAHFAVFEDELFGVYGGFHEWTAK